MPIPADDLPIVPANPTEPANPEPPKEEEPEIPIPKKRAAQRPSIVETDYSKDIAALEKQVRTVESKLEKAIGIPKGYGLIALIPIAFVLFEFGKLVYERVKAHNGT